MNDGDIHDRLTTFNETRDIAECYDMDPILIDLYKRFDAVTYYIF